MIDKIQRIHAREILDSRGQPTVEAMVQLQSGEYAIAAVPSGASTGKFEAKELRDEDPKRFFGKGVLTSIGNIVERIQPSLEGMDPRNQSKIDEKMKELDPSARKESLGANSCLAVSLATARVAAQSQKLPLAKWIGELYQPETMRLPIPAMNLINGGQHANNNLDFQEFMIIPEGAESFSEAIRMGAEVFHNLKRMLKDKGLSTAVGDEGGFAPLLRSHEEAFRLLQEAIDRSGYGAHIRLALDAAASSFYEEGRYNLRKSGKGERESEQMLELYAELLQQFPISSIEDPLEEEDWKAWKKLTSTFSNLQIVGDDLFVTQVERLERGIKERCANAILIKPNQVGTLSETFDTMKSAQKNGYACMISHRSGETEDCFIADLAVGTGAGQIKTGSLCRSERTAKYNQLLRLEEELQLSYTKL